MSKAHEILDKIPTYAGRPFAVWELVRECGSSTTYVRNIIFTLSKLRFVRRLKHGSAFKVWAQTKAWPDEIGEVYRQFDILHRFIRIQEELRVKALKRKAG